MVLDLRNNSQIVVLSNSFRNTGFSLSLSHTRAHTQLVLTVFTSWFAQRNKLCLEMTVP